jgi:hypothetical protein
MRRSLFVAALATVLSAASWLPVHAADPAPIRAVLEGQPIETRLVSNYWCHDHNYPLINCFSSAGALEAALRADAAEPGLTAAAAGDYVLVFSGTGYSGSYMYISQDYSALFFVGWNDRIRSYRGQNNGQGTFWTDWYASGTRHDFCCNVTMPYLPANLDKAFSSVYRR